jgi:hypothetical protein
MFFSDSPLFVRAGKHAANRQRREVLALGCDDGEDLGAHPVRPCLVRNIADVQLRQPPTNRIQKIAGSLAAQQSDARRRARAGVSTLRGMMLREHCYRTFVVVVGSVVAALSRVSAVQ